MAETKKKTPRQGALNKTPSTELGTSRGKSGQAQKTASKKEGGFAVIETGGKQYLVKSEEKLRVEKIEKPKKGTAVFFDKVLLVAKGDDVKIGTPYVKGAKVKAEWLKEGRAKKITNVRYKSKTRQSVKKGHRQTYAEVVIGDF